jgi:hypothetical protein
MAGRAAAAVLKAQVTDAAERLWPPVHFGCEHGNPS